MPHDFVASSDPMEDVEYIAVVQLQGLEGENSTASRGFKREVDAIVWAREQVEVGGGTIANCYESFAPFSFYTDGTKRDMRSKIIWIRSDDTPMQAYVLDLGYND